MQTCSSIECEKQACFRQRFHVRSAIVQLIPQTLLLVADRPSSLLFVGGHRSIYLVKPATIQRPASPTVTGAAPAAAVDESLYHRAVEWAATQPKVVHTQLRSVFKLSVVQAKALTAKMYRYADFLLDVCHRPILNYLDRVSYLCTATESSDRTSIERAPKCFPSAPISSGTDRLRPRRMPSKARSRSPRSRNSRSSRRRGRNRCDAASRDRASARCWSCP
jgi:hypothetical protein